MESFQQCLQITSLMKNYEHPWCIAGGWAIDLFFGNMTREHHDIEILALREDQHHLQKYLAGYSFQKVKDGQIEPWLLNEWLELPIHEAYAEDKNNKIEILFNESDNTDWIFRRDSRIRRPLSECIITSSNGVSYLNPAIGLLYKSKNPREKDEQDFKNIYRYLDKTDKQWLKEAIQICYSEHSWNDFLSQ